MENESQEMHNYSWCCGPSNSSKKNCCAEFSYQSIDLMSPKQSPVIIILLIS